MGIDCWSAIAGDLLTALLLARLHQFPDNLRLAVELATASIQGIVCKTYNSSAQNITAADPLPKVGSCCVLRIAHSSETQRVYLALRSAGDEDAGAPANPQPAPCTRA